MDEYLPNREGLVEMYVDYCKSKFGWSSLSGNVVMDVGCGKHGLCGKAIRKYFPDTTLIFMDKISSALRELESNSKMDATYDCADIEKRKSIRCFEGKIDKIVSTYVFHQLNDKEEAFRNVYRMLKPGGEAAILYNINSTIQDWSKEMMKIPKWKACFVDEPKDELFQGELARDHCREFVERIGFKVVECAELQREIPPTSCMNCRDAFYTLIGRFFNIPAELLQEFKDESFLVLQQLNVRDKDGKIYYRGTDLSVLLVKPA